VSGVRNGTESIPYRSIPSHGHRGGQVHGERHRAKHAGGVVHEHDKLAQARLADQVNDILQRGMKMPGFAALYELKASLKMIDRGLIVGGVPPFGGEVVFAARHHNPERPIVTERRQRRRGAALFG
jgi:hypothetical protein